MPIIKPVSDLRNYNDVLNHIEIEQPVFLTKNGRGKYAILDIRDYEIMQAKIKLMTKLAQSELIASEQGWLSFEDVQKELGLEDE